MRPGLDAVIDDALGVLLSDGLADVVELAVCARDGAIEAHARSGSVGFDAAGSVRWERGRNPLERQDPAAFSPLDDELANLRPHQDRNHYPFAYRSLAQLFDDPRAPDVAVVHTGAHNWEERGGHRGEHGSLGVVQSRAPLIASGAGVRALGVIEAAARMIDVAPTVAALAGIERDDGALLRAQDGEVLANLVDPAGRPARVVVFLWDGTNANVMAALAEAGELPNVARLMGGGTTYRHGLVASFPSVTLANHTTAVTGVHPGRHGILHNYYFDRSTGRQIIANAPDTWHRVRDQISRDVETIFEAVGRATGGFTAAVNEPSDRGAGYATFDLLRSGEVGSVVDALPTPVDVPGATLEFANLKREYAWSSGADNLAVQQAIELWSGARGNPRPTLMWVNLILPDSGNHLGGPYSEIGHAALRDTDRRMGQVLDAMGWGDDQTAFLLIADHGMEESDPDCKGDWDLALEAAGVRFRDEGYGFLYLDP